MFRIRTLIAPGALALLFPIAASAASSITLQYTTYTTATGTSGTVTLNAGQSVNLETGAAVSSGGDLAWDGTKLTPVGKAIAADLASLGLTGTTGYGTLNQLFLQEGLQAGLGSTSAVTPAQNDVIGVQDNSGNVAKLLVTSLSGGGSSGGSGGPTITAIQNNYSYLVPGVPNYGIAPGTLFIIKGTGLASATTVSQLQSSAAPGIPLTLNGASISVTVNGVTTHPGMYYAIATQLAAVLPSSTPVGTGTLTVNYNGGSASASITVVTTALGLDTYYGTGTGLGAATDLNYNVFNYTNSAKPGQNIVLWGSGLGADTADSDTTVTTSPHAVSVPLTIYVGGIAVTPSYAGSSGYPGLNQINITIPSNVAPGCGVSVVAVSGNIASNTVTLPIAAGGGVCSDPTTGITGTTLGNLTGKSNYNSGVLFVFQETSPTQSEGVAFGEFQNVVTTASSTVSGVTSLGSCTLSSQATGSGSSSTTGLDAGTITVTGPTGTQTLTTFPQLPGGYEVQLPSGFIPTSGGSYTFNGSGGSQVGKFSVSVSYANPLVWTNSSTITAVNRASGQTVTWTGGASGSYVYIGGTSSSSTASASFVCYAQASAGSFTVPSYVLLAMPAGNGTLSLENITTPVSFTASGLDYGTAFAGVSVSISPNYN